jgi:hypothetical protein
MMAFAKYGLCIQRDDRVMPAGREFHRRYRGPPHPKILFPIVREPGLASFLDFEASIINNDPDELSYHRLRAPRCAVTPGTPCGPFENHGGTVRLRGELIGSPGPRLAPGHPAEGRRAV